jgi:hypothetical protein
MAHSYGTIDSATEIVQMARKGSYVNAPDKCCLHKTVKTGIDITEFYTYT